MFFDGLTVCEICGAAIARSAKFCPCCGAKKKKRHPILIGLLVFLVLLSLIEPSNDSDANEYNKDVRHVGMTDDIDGVSVTLVNVIESNGSKYNEPDDGNIFLLLEFEVANYSDDEITVSSLGSFDAYCDDYACSTSFAAAMEKDDMKDLSGTLAYGKKLNGVLAYEVPCDWDVFEVSFSPSVFNEQELTFVMFGQ